MTITFSDRALAGAQPRPVYHKPTLYLKGLLLPTVQSQCGGGAWQAR